MTLTPASTDEDFRLALVTALIERRVGSVAMRRTASDWGMLPPLSASVDAGRPHNPDRAQIAALAKHFESYTADDGGEG